MSHQCAYGAWPSPLSAEALAQSSRRIGHLAVDRDSLYWLENRPDEGGRGVVMVKDENGIRECTPPGLSVRSRVYEYGGGDFWVGHGHLIVVADKDQRLYRIFPDGSQQVLTPEPPRHRAWRYADGCFLADGRHFICIRERHEDAQVIHELVRVAIDGSAMSVVASGADFYAAPRIAPDGRLAWIEWQHPDMPWDSALLCLAEPDAGGGWSTPRRIAGGDGESVSYPQFGPDGRLFFVSDRAGFASLYALDPDGVLETLTPMPGEVAPAYWGLGYAPYAFDRQGQLLVYMVERGIGRWLLLDPDTDRIQVLSLPFTAMAGCLVGFDDGFVVVASGPRLPERLVQIRGDGHLGEILRTTSEALPDAFISVAQTLDYPSLDGTEAHAFYYPPTHPECQGLAGEMPPLLVMSHGGPTGATTTGYNPAIQFWTTRGFAVVDVNYRGSTGYGREYRDALNGGWGLGDADDCVAAARALVARGRVDRGRLLIRGGSAGGYTTLSALIRHRDFAAAMSRYGVADLESLVKDSHKFEAHYLDRLIAPYRSHREVYRARSPIHRAEHLACPLLILQGQDDPVVPPGQSKALAEALARNGVAHAYLEFSGEGHGFRRGETIIRALQAELAFYRQVLGIDADEVLPSLRLRQGPGV